MGRATLVGSVLCLLVLYVLPIWLYPLFPSQDGPSHLYNTVIFSDLLWNERTSFGPTYEINWTPFPNWLFTMIASFMYPLLTIIQVEKVVLTIYLASFVGAFFYFVRSFNLEKTILGFVGFLFGYNWFLWMGFYNFCLSLPLALLTIGFAVRHRGFVHGQRLYLLMLMFLSLYLSHVVSFALVLLVVAVMFGAFGQKRWGALLELALSASPALGLFIIYYFTQTKAEGETFRAPFAFLAMCLASFKIGPWFRGEEWPWFVAMWLLLAFWMILSWRNVRNWTAEERVWLYIALGTVVLTLVCPYNFLGGTSLNERLAFFAGIFLVATLSPRTWTISKVWLGIAFAILVAAQLIYVHVAMRDWNRQLEPFHQLSRRVEPYAKALPLIYEDNVVGIYANPLVHAHSYALAKALAVSPTNYEGLQPYFPVHYKTKLGFPVPSDWHRPDAFLEGDLAKHFDCVILWKASPSVLASPALQGFTTVFVDGNLRLLKRR